jgi:hypothetical protein
VIGVYVGSFCTHHGLYHGLIELARLPYLSHDHLPSDASHGSHARRTTEQPTVATVRDVMSAPLVTVGADQSRMDLMPLLGSCATAPSNPCARVVRVRRA